MSLHLNNPSGSTFAVSAGHWAVYLHLAQAFGWKPAGTQRPTSLPTSEAWDGRYDTSDGQTVTDSESKLLAQVLHAAAVSPKIGVALSDVIAHVEALVERSGTSIPSIMRMNPNDFSKEFSPLLKFLYAGTFQID